MAFSGRARRPGAFSTGAAKPAEALSDAPFVGEWLDEDGELVTIKNSKIHASDGGTMDLNVKSATQASFKMDGELYSGTLSPDGGKIVWSDGAAWMRKGQKPGGAAGGADDPAEEARKAEAAKKAAEEEAIRRQMEEAKQKAQEMAKKKAEDEAMAKKAAALEKAKAAAAAAEAKAATEAEPASAAGSSLDQEKARVEAGLDKAKAAYEAEKARKAAALERAKAAKAAQEAAKASEAEGGLTEAKAKSEAGLDKARAAFEAEKARKAAALERARAAKEEAEKKREEAAAGDASDPAKAKSEAGIDKARAAFEAEKARKAAALEKARAAKAAEAAGAETAEDPKAVEAKAKSQAGLDKARAAFEAEKARKAAALEKARAAKAAAEQEAEQAKAAPAGKEVDEAKAKSEAGLNKARAAFEAEKARKAAALEKARAAKAAQEAAEKEEAQGQGKSKDFEEAKQKSTAGLDKARAAFEAEKARKAAALEKARAKAAAEAAAKGAGGGDDDDEDDEPPSLTTASGAGAKRGSAFSSALNKAGPPPQQQTFTGPPKGKTMSAFTSPGVPQELGPPDAGAEEVEMVTEVVQLSEADFEPGIVVKLQNLKTKPELNGQWGVLVEFSEAKKRWSVRIDGMEDMALRGENLQAVSQEEYDAWMAEQANVEASAKYEMEAMLKSRVCGGKTRWTDSDAGKVVRAPGENGNEFDICMGVEPDGQRAARKVADVMKDKGVCLVEANAPPDLLYQAYEEAEKLWKAGDFAPPMQEFGASELEMAIWSQVLFQDEQKATWIGEDAGEKMQALGLLGQNLRDFATGLQSCVGQKLNINFTNLWDSMLVCYSGDRSYSFHIDNPCMPDEHSLPDNGLRLTLAYFINPHWSPENGYNGGGLDVYMSPPSGPPESLTKARKCNRVRIAPHADTLVVFPSQRMAHQVIPTKGKELWFCLWMWCFDEEVMEKFPMKVHEHWQRQNGEAPSPRGSNQGGEEDDEEEVIDD